MASGQVEWSSRAIDLAAVGFALFVGITLALQMRRARPRADATLAHWWLAAGSALMAAVGYWLDAPAELLGVLLLVGVGIGVTSGMLLKIVPFLTWFHLQSRQIAQRRFDVRLPHMHRLLPQRLARWHPFLHALALLLLSFAVYEPRLASYGGLALALANLWLFGLLMQASVRYFSAAGSLEPHAVTRSHP